MWELDNVIVLLFELCPPHPPPPHLNAVKVHLTILEHINVFFLSSFNYENNIKGEINIVE
jgi:hypothetical protein